MSEGRVSFPEEFLRKIAIMWCVHKGDPGGSQSKGIEVERKLAKQALRKGFASGLRSFLSLLGGLKHFLLS